MSNVVTSIGVVLALLAIGNLFLNLLFSLGLWVMALLGMGSMNVPNFVVIHGVVAIMFLVTGFLIAGIGVLIEEFW